MRTWVRNHQLLTFFGLSYLLAYVPLYGHVFVTTDEPMSPWTLVWFVNVFSPTLAAMSVAWLIGGGAKVKRLLSGFTRWRVNSRWYLAAAFLILGPLAIAVIYIVLGNPATGLQPGVTLPMLLGIIVTQLFSGPISEEAGWRGFALPRLQAKYTALVSSLILGVIWTFWHLPLYFVSGSAQRGIPLPIYLVLICTLTLYITWIYNNSRGSLILTTLAHASFNLTGVFITGTISLMPPMAFYMTIGPLFFVCILVIVFGFGAKYFSKKPLAELPFQKGNA